MIEKNLQKYAALFSGHTELRMQENRSSRLSLLNGSLMTNEASSSRGISARVCRAGAWGFTAIQGTDPEDVKRAIAAAAKNARSLSSVLDKRAIRPHASPATSCRDYSTKKKRRTQKEQIEFAKEIDGYLSKFKWLKSRSVNISALDMEKSLITSFGSEAYSLVPRTTSFISISTDRKGKLVNLGSLIARLGHIEDVFPQPSDLFGELDQLYLNLMKKSECVSARSGKSECVLASDVTAMLAHEAIGHTAEADNVRFGSVAGNLLNKAVASPLVTLVDLAHTYEGKPCNVPVHVDDEGTRAEDVTIIDKGVLKSYMHSRASAAYFKMHPTGNARAYSFSDEPIVRMRNTAVLPGKSRVEDMIASVKDGYYLIQASNGQADITSEFMFGISLGYEIKNGKLGKAINDTAVSGVAYEMLKTVSMVSDKILWDCSGMCGKKQSIPVSIGGPAIKCVVNIGGK
ncbi:MAG: peptidase [Elusimicrobia bacterium HGW-Elusimicrobia-3]|jgi:TldD protein|nr:MAG: peptidase [Elusimicrobia bacterium HGW-Elusimicrobia-3]